jgi:hypothetical protein
MKETILYFINKKVVTDLILNHYLQLATCLSSDDEFILVMTKSCYDKSVKSDDIFLHEVISNPKEDILSVRFIKL